MSEYLFGVSRGAKLSQRTIQRRDRVCREEGGHGYQQARDGGRWLSWFSAPNRGEPFDSRLSGRVLCRVLGEEEEP